MAIEKDLRNGQLLQYLITVKSRYNNPPCRSLGTFPLVPPGPSAPLRAAARAAAMTYRTIDFANEGGIARLTLNRPDRLNSFTVEMHEEVADALAQARRRAGAGADRRRPRLLRRPGSRRPRGGAGRGGRSRRVGRAALQSADPHADRRCPCRSSPGSTASRPAPAPTSRSPATSSSPRRSAKFIQSFAAIGLIPDSGGTWVLPRLVGQARALGLALTGEPLPAEQGGRMGPDLEGGRRRGSSTPRSTRSPPASPPAPTAGLARIKTDDPRKLGPQPRRGARPPARRDARARLQRRLSRGRRGVHGEAEAELHGDADLSCRDQLRCELRQVDIAARDDADDRPLARPAGQRRGQRQRAGAFGDHPRLLGEQPHRLRASPPA